jgi:membrane protease YdiL (CAAX protease family)
MLSLIYNAVRRHPLLTFVVLAYAFSWWPWLLFGSEGPVVGFGPFFAALLVLALTAGKPGVRALFAQMVRWRVNPGWYAAALLIPVGLGILGACVIVLLGAPAPSAAQLAGWTNVLPTFLIALLVPGLFGVWEEPGWRGFALPRLAAGRRALVASLLLWPIVVTWHFPLFFTGGIHWTDVPAMLGAVLVYNWIYWGTRGSVLLVMIIHAANNAFSGEYLSTLFTGDASEQLGLMRAVLWCAAGLVVALMLSRADFTRAAVAPTGRAAEPAAGD